MEHKPMDNFSVQMSVKIESSKDPNKPFGTSQKVHKGEPADTNKMLTDIFKQMQNLIQSNEEVFMKGFQMTFKFTEIPSGGTSTGATTSRNREDILNKASVHKIKNNDNNCFWYALVMLLFRDNARWDLIRKGGPQRTKLAKELAELARNRRPPRHKRKNLQH